MNVEYVDVAGIQTAGPQIAAVIGEPHVVGLVASADGDGIDDLAVGGRVRPHVDGHQLVGFVSHALHAERPDVDEFLLAGDFRHVGRLAGLIGYGR